ncbi:MAG: hypothetical protein GY700_06085 [Propionibacteriaceae bacterium]|nr:hypothetical protein [Propionibacteriaceae bacterium]
MGMDVVRRNIDALRGVIEIQSERGVGSLFSIRLPLTLAIIDGMVIRVGDQRFIVPTLSVIQSIRPEPGDLSTVMNRGEMLIVQDELIPVARLHDIFTIEGAEQDITKAVVVVLEAEGHRIGLVTDELLGQQQVVIKSLGDTMQGIQGIAGGAIMPDGHVGLILDVAGFIKTSRTADPEE